MFNDSEYMWRLVYLQSLFCGLQLGAKRLDLRAQSSVGSIILGREWMKIEWMKIELMRIELMKIEWTPARLADQVFQRPQAIRNLTSKNTSRREIKNNKIKIEEVNNTFIENLPEEREQ